MNKAIPVCIMISTMLFGTNVFARTWYEKSCTPTQKDKDGNYYVGGSVNNYHLHIGTDFISVFSINNTSKPESNGKVNCDLLKKAVADHLGGGYKSPNDVVICLNAAMEENSCE
jgi:hypothetical protein